MAHLTGRGVCINIYDIYDILYQSVVNTTLGCEQLCAAQGKACIGFTYSGANCYFYGHVSGYFSPDPGVSWHPKPKA